jgi:hypothetical protein
MKLVAVDLGYQPRRGPVEVGLEPRNEVIRQRHRQPSLAEQQLHPALGFAARPLRPSLAVELGAERRRARDASVSLERPAELRVGYELEGVRLGDRSLQLIAGGAGSELEHGECRRDDRDSVLRSVVLIADRTDAVEIDPASFAGLPGDGHDLDIIRRQREDPEQAERRSPPDQRPVADGQDRRQFPARRSHRSSAEQVDALMNTMKRAALMPRRDHAPGHAGGEQLLGRDQVELVACHPRGSAFAATVSVQKVVNLVQSDDPRGNLLPSRRKVPFKPTGWMILMFCTRAGTGHH